MKKTLIAFAALSAIAGIAQAQSTVTIYGLLDTNVNSSKFAAVSGATIQSLRQTKIDSGGLNGSRWGIRFKEDLGGGMAAIGNLESGFNIDTGASAQGGLLFGRRANVGLTGGFGTLTLGRNSSSYDDVAADHAMMGETIFDPSGVNNGNSAAVAATLGTLAGNVAFLNKGNMVESWVGYNTRFNNSAKYISPTWGGFSGSFMYALGEDKTATVDASKTISANLKWVNGPILVSGGYQSEGGTRTATAKPALQNTLISFAYDFGVAKLGLGANRAKYKDVVAPAALNGGVAGGAFAAQKEYNVSVAVPLGATTLSMGYGQSKGDTLGKSSGFGIQALYALSKRTNLYIGGASVKSYDKLRTAAAAAAPGSNIDSRQQEYGLGIRHTF